MVRVYLTECRSALNRSGIPGIDYCVNPYTGCEHGCVYCYACFMRRFCEIKDPWGSFVQVKINFLDRLKTQLRQARPGQVMFSTVTDPYQPLERKFCLTRSSLELLAGAGFRISILTKSELVLRDLDLLKGLPGVDVGFTITVVDTEVARILEPRASLPNRRFEALARLADAGIRTWVFVAPVVPGLGDTEENLGKVLEKSRWAGALEVDYDPLNFYPTVVARLERLFFRKWPHLSPFFHAAYKDQISFRHRLRQRARLLWPQFGYPPPS